ncbi:hypothetical protein [Legionella tunisiensis]|uniref:hypothetical protein n=1 Tax=Legionella tunisiensis TaxID=1034944 RepID=UPI00036ABFA1|nr:hypothetical protein [Legionella tunisiensis]
MMDHFAFHYNLGFILQALAVCRTFNPAVKLLLLDVRHYSSPKELLKLIIVVTEHLTNSEENQVFFAKQLEGMLSYPRCFYLDNLFRYRQRRQTLP